jgi:hypothetical protein
VALLAGRGGGSLAARALTRVPGDKGAVAAADLNGDGLPDLAIVDGVNVSVLLTRPDASFEQPVAYPTETAATLDVATGDLNRDGRQDLLAVGDLLDFVIVYLGNGDGTFRRGVDGVSGTGPTSLAAGDLNGDGNLDVVTAITDPPGLSVLLGKGDGTLRVGADVPVGRITGEPALADLNGDGRLDVAVANAGAGTISVLPGKGNGTFAAPVAYRALEAPSTPAAGDVDGDGKLDLVVGPGRFGGTSVAVLLGRGNGAFGAPGLVGLGGKPTDVRLGDVNGDGRLDLVASVFDSLAVRLGNGDGTFRARAAIPVAPPICLVPGLRDDTLKIARADLAAERCTVGRVTRRVAKGPAGRVISQRPKLGTELLNRGRVDLVLSRRR